MESETRKTSTPKAMLWTGRILSALPVLLMGVGGIFFGLMKPDEVAKGVTHLGYPAHVARPILILEIVCAVLYAIPQTSVLGAILLTAYLGGATASHVRV